MRIQGLLNLTNRLAFIQALLNRSDSDYQTSDGRSALERTSSNDFKRAGVFLINANQQTFQANTRRDQEFLTYFTEEGTRTNPTGTRDTRILGRLDPAVTIDPHLTDLSIRGLGMLSELKSTAQHDLATMLVEYTQRVLDTYFSMKPAEQKVVHERVNALVFAVDGLTDRITGKYKNLRSDNLDDKLFAFMDQDAKMDAEQHTKAEIKRSTSFSAEPAAKRPLLVGRASTQIRRRNQDQDITRQA